MKNNPLLEQSLNFAKYHPIMFAIAKIIEMTKEEENKVALFLFNTDLQ